MSNIDKELLKGATETLVLSVLSAQPSHGYELVQRLKQRSAGIFQFGEGTLYPLLYKLEDKGLIRGEWQESTGQRRRRIYRVTPKGKRQLNQRTAQWSRLVEGMTLILGEPAHG